MLQEKASRNRTLSCTESEVADYSKELLSLGERVLEQDIENRIFCQDMFEACQYLPHQFADLLILDPPYNLTKDFHGQKFRAMGADSYQAWFRSVLSAVVPLLKNNATIYVCSDWKTSGDIYPILNEFFQVRNRITWERDKGRGAKTNWKNNTEDIWFCTMSDEYYFDLDSVKMKKKVIAPYRDESGQPKDWESTEQGNFRLTHPSNIWTDITVPFWSMPENTDHPTQKPEKLLAKLILASSKKNAVVFDPFLGSGTTAVVSRKLGRSFTGIEINNEYCCWALKRLDNIQDSPDIQGYSSGVFWERNSLSVQKKATKEGGDVIGGLFS
ncbi:MAG: site-specific DNA-methyltransferase [Alphaproteobacteria bacterium CG1_02_46_17]|nr:MAG: site-specific DNA-methyltransferase [Alphaproteobacteria bacterium CG1_02_46_17]